jgi:ABC-type sugar transport system ATPase subunit
MASGATKLRMSGISKTFPGVRALDDVSFEANAGEIVGVVGVNGAGKSTLMNILGGIYQPDHGDIVVDGKRIAFHSPKDAANHGVAFIHQELLFFASQTAAENIFISHLFVHQTVPVFVSKKTANREAKRYLEMLGSDISPTARMEDLSVGERQVVEIARALAMGSQIVIFDEPTSSLSFKEKEILFRVINRLKVEGKAIIYISHFIDEILELCDKFVVLRNGRVHGHGEIGDVTRGDIIRMVIGRDITAEAKAAKTVGRDVVLKVDNIESGRLVRNVSFELNRGEILGIWGLMGSGRTELIRAILGLDPINGGSICLTENGTLTQVTPRGLLAHCGYITESRHTDGLFLTHTISRNITATALEKYASRFFRFLNIEKEIKTTTDYMSSLRIVGQGHGAKLESLSGGNQQKVVFAKWLNRRPRIMVMDEPTRGVDVGAKLEIGSLVRQLSGEGISMLLITSEVEEMVSLSDRVLVLRDGKIVTTVVGADINNATLMSLALGEERLDA